MGLFGCRPDSGKRATGWWSIKRTWKMPARPSSNEPAHHRRQIVTARAPIIWQRSFSES